MNHIKGNIQFNLPMEEVNKINELIDRDTAKAMEQVNEKLTACPVCGYYGIVPSWDFCPRCGQRVDHENIAL